MEKQFEFAVTPEEAKECVVALAKAAGLVLDKNSHDMPEFLHEYLQIMDFIDDVTEYLTGSLPHERLKVS